MPLLALAIAVFLYMVLEALSVAVSGYVFLDSGFWDSWHMAWDRPVMLALFAIITLLFKGND